MSTTSVQARSYVQVAGIWVPATGTAVGSINAQDVNLAGSAGGVAATSGTLTGSGSAVTATVSNSGNATIAITGGTYTNLPIIFEGTVDGTNWFPIDAVRTDGTVIDIAPTLPASATRAWNVIAPGYSSIRVRQTAAAGAQTGNPTVTVTQGPFLYDPSPSVAPIDGQKPTYSASASNVTATVAGIVLSLSGSATKTVRLTRLTLAQVATSGTAQNIQVVKYSAAPTSGTSATMTAIPHDSLSAAATASAKSWSVAPTAGTTVGSIRAKKTFSQATTAAPQQVEMMFGNSPSQAVVLRGTAETIGITFSAALTGGVMSADIEWTEE